MNVVVTIRRDAFVCLEYYKTPEQRPVMCSAFVQRLGLCCYKNAPISNPHTGASPGFRLVVCYRREMSGNMYLARYGVPKVGSQTPALACMITIFIAFI